MRQDFLGTPRNQISRYTYILLHTPLYPDSLWSLFYIAPFFARSYSDSHFYLGPTYIYFSVLIQERDMVARQF